MARLDDNEKENPFRVSFGHVLTFASALAVVAASYGATANQITDTQADVTEIKADVQSLQAARFDDNARMVRVETLLNEILSELRTR